LKLQFSWDGDEYATEWTPSDVHQGWSGIVHGGLIAVVFDEVLSRAALECYGMEWVTAEINVRLNRPAKIGSRIRFVAKLVTVRKKLIVTRGTAVDVDSGLQIASGEAKLMRVQ